MVGIALLPACVATPRDASREPGSAALPRTFETTEGTTIDPFAAEPGSIIALVFITTECPIANAYVPELRRLAASWAARDVRFVLVHPDPHTTPAQARAHAEAFGLPQPVILDPAQHLARHFGATVTPEAVVARLGAGSQLPQRLYLGRIDDRYRDWGRRRAEPTRRDLDAAIARALQGEPPDTTPAPAIGCFIPGLGDRDAEAP